MIEDLTITPQVRVNKHVLKKAVKCKTLGWKMARQEKEVPDVELATLFKQGNDVEEAAIDEMGGGRKMPARLQMAANHTAVFIEDAPLNAFCNQCSMSMAPTFDLTLLTGHVVKCQR